MRFKGHISIIFLWVLGVLITSESICSAHYFDKKEMIAIESLRRLIGLADSKRNLDSQTTDAKIEAAGRTSYPLAKLAAIHELAFANDEASLLLLKQIAQEGETDDLSEFLATMESRASAKFALLVRQGRQETPQVQFNMLETRLKETADPFERMFIANRMAVEFPQEATPIILRAAKVEEQEILRNREENIILSMFSAMARLDMLFYLVRSNDPQILSEVVKWKAKPPTDALDGRMPEYLVLLMSALTPGRSPDEEENSWKTLIETARRKLEEHKR